MRWLDGITDTMGMSLSKVREIVKGREVWHAAVHEVPKSQTWFSDWTTTKELEISAWRQVWNINAYEESEGKRRGDQYTWVSTHTYVFSLWQLRGSRSNDTFGTHILVSDIYLQEQKQDVLGEMTDFRIDTEVIQFLPSWPVDSIQFKSILKFYRPWQANSKTHMEKLLVE